MKNPTNRRTEDNVAVSAANATKLIADAADRATTTIANAVMEATKLLALNAAEATKLLAEKSSSDHDLLIELKTRMEGLKVDIKEIKDGYSMKIEDHESRIQTLCKWQAAVGDVEKLNDRVAVLEKAKSNDRVWMAGISAFLTIAAALIVFHILQKGV